MNRFISIFFVLVVILLAWAPWLDAQQAETIVTTEFNAEWKGVSDGCGPIEQFKDTHRILFGFVTTIKYSCPTKSLEIDEIIHKQIFHSVYVSPFMNSYGDFKKVPLN